MKLSVYSQLRIQDVLATGKFTNYVVTYVHDKINDFITFASKNCTL